MSEFRIDGVGEFRVTRVPALEAIELLHEIAAFAGVAVNELPQMVFALRSADENADALAHLAVLRSVVEIARRNDPTKTTALIRKIMTKAEIRTESGMWAPADADQLFDSSALDKLQETVGAILSSLYQDFMRGPLRSLFDFAALRRQVG